MKFISRRVHAMLDYIVGILLILAPTLLGFSHIPGAKYSAIIAGVLVLGMALLTRHEGGVAKVIPMSTHLVMDVILGILLALSPWLLNFSDQVFLPHLIVGVFSIIAGLCTAPASQHGVAQGGVLS
ncbi:MULTISPECIES: SPW repeat domain-containing protein [Olivibacter]|uniref:SPW repeat protein n=1 Tax=Olivibacter oleidegradans TaxID=760123 RepID=A0ABV6HHG8_9SPHI|nr:MULTISPECIES: SPW repeat protein [Olivibacter]MDM8176488.1 SPW repeat protein [Olivibacter sp. 47]QEL00748.1 hypothetical protein FKG96_07975 [Olivibacter sp. LS-1]